MLDPIDKLAFYFDAGGYVMVPITLACLGIWYGIGYRWSVLRRRDPRSVRHLIERQWRGTAPPARDLISRAVERAVAVSRQAPQDLRRQLDDEFAEDVVALKRWALAVTALIAVAPVLGLLGTVTGMIETFNSLGEMRLHSASGGIAGGISQALFTTQLGLAVAIPAFIVNSILDRRTRERHLELAQIKDILCALEPRK